MTLLKIPGVFSGMASRYELFGLMVRKDPDLGNVSWHRVSFFVPTACDAVENSWCVFGDDV